MTSRPPGGLSRVASDEFSPIEFLVIQPTAFCNINCQYCYIPGRDRRRSVDLETLSGIASNILLPGFVSERLLVAWHCGEPLTLPISFYDKAFRVIEAGVPHTGIVHHFQTNGTLLTSEWAEFFAHQNVIVGISLDGPEQLHDKFRKTRSSTGTHRAALNGIKELLRQDIVPNIICVLNAYSLQIPEEIFLFFEKLGLTNISFNVEEVVGANTTSSIGQDLIDSVHRFFETYLDLIEQHGSEQRIREIDQIAARILTRSFNPRFESCVVPFRHLCTDVAGNYWTFSPELGFGANGADVILGNCTRDKISDVLESEHFHELRARIEVGTSRCQSSCRYFELCGGGNPANKYSETGRFETSETLFCRLNIKLIADLMVERLLKRITDQNLNAEEIRI